jgi:hypothetical protein
MTGRPRRGLLPLRGGAFIPALLDRKKFRLMLELQRHLPEYLGSAVINCRIRQSATFLSLRPKVRSGGHCLLCVGQALSINVARNATCRR